LVSSNGFPILFHYDIIVIHGIAIIVMHDIIITVIITVVTTGKI